MVGAMVSTHHNLVGLARVSTVAQDAQLQRDALTAAGGGRIFEEKVSTRGAARPGLAAALDYLRPDNGDVLAVWKLDRLGRSVKDVLTIADDLHGRGIGVRILTGKLSGTYSPTGEGKFFFTMMAAFAELSVISTRDILHERTLAGLAAARAQGRTGGRPTVMDSDKLAAAQARRAKVRAQPRSPRHWASPGLASTVTSLGPKELQARTPNRRWLWPHPVVDVCPMRLGMAYLVQLLVSSGWRHSTSSQPSLALLRSCSSILDPESGINWGRSRIGIDEEPRHGVSGVRRVPDSGESCVASVWHRARALRRLRAPGLHPECEPRAYTPSASVADSDAATDRLVEWLSTQAKDRSGIWRDIAVHHRTTEIPTHYAPVLALADNHAIPVPLLRALLGQLAEVETDPASMAQSRLAHLDTLAHGGTQPTTDTTMVHQ